MIADVNSPEPEFPLPSAQCLFCKKEGVKGGGVGYVICDLFRYELMQYKAIQLEEYSMCFKCGSVINYVVYIKRLLLTALFGLPAVPPIFTRELPDISKNFNENVRFILRCNIQDDCVSPMPNVQVSAGRKNGSRLSPQLTNKQPDDSRDDTDPLLIETWSSYEEPANIGYHRYNEDGRIRAQSEPRTRSRRSNSTPKRPRTQLSRSRSQATHLVCKWQNCRLVCQSQKKLTLHYDEEHKFKCSICNECSFESRPFLEKHKKENHDRKCKICKMAIKPDEFRKHSKIEHNLQCPYCTLKFHRCKELTEHTRTKHDRRPILERNVKRDMRNETHEIDETRNSPTFEVIILNNNNISSRTPIRSWISPILEADSIIESRTAILNNKLPFPENTDAQQNVTEVSESDNSIQIEREISSSPLGREVQKTKMSIDNVEQDTYLTTDPTCLTNLQPNSNNTMRENDISSEPLVSVSPGPPVLVSSETSDLLPSELPASVSPGPPVLSQSEAPSVSTESPALGNIEDPVHNPRRSRRRKLYSITVPQLSPTKNNAALITHTSIRSDIEKIESFEQQSHVPTDFARDLRKKHVTIQSFKPSSPSIMNTRSRCRSQRVKIPMANDLNIRRVSVEDDLVETLDKKKEYNAVIEDHIVPATKSLKEKSTRSTKSQDKTLIEKDVEDSQLFNAEKTKRSKRTVENLDDVNDMSAEKVDNKSVDENVQVITNQEQVDNFLTKDSIDPTVLKDVAINTNPNAFSDTLLENTMKTRGQDDPSSLTDNISNTDVQISNPSNKTDIIRNIPPSSDDANDNQTSENVDDGKPARISQISETDSIIVQNADVCAKNANINSADVHNITDISFEDHDSNDSKSLIIHEEEVQTLVEPSESVSDQLQDNIQYKVSSDTHTIPSNMDEIIESVVKAENVIRKPKMHAKKLLKPKNVKLEHSNLTAKGITSVGNKYVGNMLNQPHSSSPSTVPLVVTKAVKSTNILSSIRKNTKIPENKTIRIEGKSGEFESVTRYILSKVDSGKTVLKKKYDTSSSTDNSSISLYTKPSANKKGNILGTFTLDDASTSSQKPVQKLVDFSITSENHAAAVIDSIYKIKPKKRGRNNQKERSDRRATNFDEFISGREMSTDLTTKSEDQFTSSNRIPKLDAYTFPESDNYLTSSYNDTVDTLNIDMSSKNVANYATQIPNNEPPIKKKRVKSKPRRNTSFDNYITEASQRYYRNH